MLFGRMVLMDNGEAINFRCELRAEDYRVEDLKVSQTAIMWYNTTVKRLRLFDGTSVKSFAWQGEGGEGGGGILPDGSIPMTGDLILSSDDQSAGENDNVAVSRGYMNRLLNNKMNKLSGLGGESVVVTDAEGNLAVSATTADELTHLSGVTSNIQQQLDNKMSSGNLILTSDLNAGGYKISGLGAPESDSDAARRADVRNAISVVPLLAACLDIQVDASLDPSTEIGARYLITDAGQLHPNFNNPPEAENNCILERISATEFETMWAPSDAGPGYQTWIDSKGNFYEYNGTAWTERIIGAKPLSGTGTTVDVDGKVSVNITENAGLKIDADNKLALVLNSSYLTADAQGVKLADDSVGMSEISDTILGAGLKLNEAGTEIIVDNEALVTAGFLKGTEFDDITILDAPTEDTHGANKKYVDDQIAGLEFAKIVSKEFTTEATEFVYQHNANSRWGNVQVYELTGSMIVPSSVELVDANNLKVVLPESKAVRIVFTY